MADDGDRPETGSSPRRVSAERSPGEDRQETSSAAPGIEVDTDVLLSPTSRFLVFFWARINIAWSSLTTMTQPLTTHCKAGPASLNMLFDASCSLPGSPTSSSYTASLTSSVINYPMEHGRRYHAYRSGREL